MLESSRSALTHFTHTHQQNRRATHTNPQTDNCTIPAQQGLAQTLTRAYPNMHPRITAESLAACPANRPRLQSKSNGPPKGLRKTNKTYSRMAATSINNILHLQIINTRNKNYDQQNQHMNRDYCKYSVTNNTTTSSDQHVQQ